MGYSVGCGGAGMTRRDSFTLAAFALLLLALLVAFTLAAFTLLLLALLVAGPLLWAWLGGH
jgi:hypothetical protein